jgi:hypothetical protein
MRHDHITFLLFVYSFCLKYGFVRRHCSVRNSTLRMQEIAFSGFRFQKCPDFFWGGEGDSVKITMSGVKFNTAPTLEILKPPRHWVLH